MSSSMLDALVRFAAFGASGVSVLGVAWCGYIIMNLPDETSDERYNILKYYMNMCMAVAVISCVSGVTNSWIKYSHVQRKQKQVEEKQEKIRTYRHSLTKLNKQIQGTDLSNNPEIRKTLQNLDVTTIPSEPIRPGNTGFDGVRRESSGSPEEK